MDSPKGAGKKLGSLEDLHPLPERERTKRILSRKQRELEEVPTREKSSSPPGKNTKITRGGGETRRKKGGSGDSNDKMKRRDCSIL